MWPHHRLAPLRLFDEPQGHRNDVPRVRADRRRDRHAPVRDDAARAPGARHPDLLRPEKIWMPGSWSSSRIIPDRSVPITPAISANTRYIVPMSLWFVE